MSNYRETDIFSINDKGGFTEKYRHIVYSDELEETSDIIVNKAYNETLELIDEFPYVYETVADMQAATLEAGDICSTLGFHASGDGGAAFYKITATGTANGMDVLACGDLFANLVITESYVTPEMFGAAGDGIVIENIYLNRCFAFAYQNRLAVIGKGEYLVDDSTNTIDSHKGVLVPGPINMSDLRLKLADNVAALTSILTCKYGSGNYLIERCSFETGVYPSNTGRESGGNHAIFFADSSTFPTDWQVGFGNVEIQNCKFSNVWCYSIFATPFVGKLHISNCVFDDVYGIGVLPYCTDSVIENCRYSIKEYTGRTMVQSLAHDEIENFAGTLSNYEKRILIKDSTSNCRVFSVQSSSQSSVVYSNVSIMNCASIGSNTIQSIVVYAQTYETANVIKKIDINNCELQKVELTKAKDTVISINESTVNDRLYLETNGSCAISDSIVAYIHMKECLKLTADTVHFSSSNAYYGCISTIDLITQDVSGIPLIVLNNVSKQNGQYFLRNCRFTKCFINGIYDVNGGSLHICNNYGYRNDTTQRSLFVTNMFDSYTNPAGDYCIQGVQNVALAGISPTIEARLVAYQTTKAIDVIYPSA